MEDRKESAAGRLLKGMGRYIREISEFAPRKIPVSEIDLQSVGTIILYSILAEDMRLGNRSSMLFSVSAILPNLGYRVIWTGEDYRAKFPAEYEAVRRELDEMVRKDVLKMVPLKNADVHHETVCYQVVNKKALKEIITRPV